MLFDSKGNAITVGSVIREQTKRGKAMRCIAINNADIGSFKYIGLPQLDPNNAVTNIRVSQQFFHATSNGWIVQKTVA